MRRSQASTPYPSPRPRRPAQDEAAPWRHPPFPHREPSPRTALWNEELYLASGPDRQRLRDQIGLGECMAQQEQARRRLIVVELADEGGEHLLDGQLAVMTGEIGAVAPILPAAEEEY